MMAGRTVYKVPGQLIIKSDETLRHNIDLFHASWRWRRCVQPANPSK